MASDSDEFGESIENLKASVKRSFTRIYASLKARELKTLRQLDAIRKQCMEDKYFNKNCIQSINISYDNESTLLNNVSNFGVINFDKFNFDSSTFTLEDYVSPDNDHMYSYKTIEDLTKEEDLQAIEEAALKEITKTDICVCHVNIRTEDVSKKFRDSESSTSGKLVTKCFNTHMDVIEPENVTEDDKSDISDVDLKKIDPTDDWLNSIKNQTETEPSQVSDVMEHSTIACS